MMPTPNVDSGIAGADVILKLLLRAVDETAPYEGSPSREYRYHCLVDEYDQVLGFELATIQRRSCGPCLGARLAGCKKGMDATVITLDVVSSIFASREIGWKIRSEVIWHKPEHAPNAAKDRLTPAHELLFHFVKRKDAYYDMDAIRKPSSPPMSGKKGVVSTPRSRVPTDVWTIRTEDSNFPENQYAVFPEALVELPIRATCPRGGTVLDPFVGSGTTAVVALRLGRKAIGIDDSADFLEFTKKRILELTGQPATHRQGPLNHALKVDAVLHQRHER